ncbi:serine hydrolase [Dankookia sp. GCM10030260]|uniref:serine hydrolase n=1 Tax=Dankookia sp. GCM10030260 TaxID=3273390 RepID=UPI003610E4DE
MTVDPFPTSAVPLGFVTNDAALTSGMAALADLPGFMVLCAGLVDLTGDPDQPPYAGLADGEMLYAGSLLKVCALYAAFELRARVRQHVAEAIDAGTATDMPGWEKPVFAALLRAWQPALAEVMPKLPATPPNLGRLFAVTPDGDVDFTAADPALTDAEIDAVGEFGTPRGGYRDWLRSMLRWSNNAAASRCILGLGYPFIAGTLRGAALIDADMANGLWLSGDYLGHDWVPNAAAGAQANAAGRPLSPRWATAQKRQRSNFTATAAQVATLMTLLAKDLLVDQAASQEMRDLMTGAEGIGSYIGGTLAQDGRATDLVVSKIGYGDDTRSHDCAIVERTVDGRPIRYVVVGLGSQAGNRRSLGDLFIQLDQLILDRNA